MKRYAVVLSALFALVGTITVYRVQYKPVTVIYVNGSGK
jgi:hypothetical protein